MGKCKKVNMKFQKESMRFQKESVKFQNIGEVLPKLVIML